MTNPRYPNPILDGILGTVMPAPVEEEKEQVPEVEDIFTPDDETDDDDEDDEDQPKPTKPIVPVKKVVPQNSLFESIIKNVAVERLDLTEAEKAIVNATIDNLSKSYAAIIRTCSSDSCKIKDICPFSRIGKYPERALCPVEQAVADYTYSQYCKMLEEELGVQAVEFNILEISTITNLVECDLEELRTRTIMNHDGALVHFAAFAIKETGRVIYNENEHPLYNVRDRLNRRKHQLLQRILMSPESRAKYHVNLSNRERKDTKAVINEAERKIQDFHKLQDNKSSSNE